MQQVLSSVLELWRSLLGALIFYTIIPIPNVWQPSFHRISRWCPLIGLMLGTVLSLLFWGLTLLDSPALMKSVILVGFWLGFTGGLHLDGAMDSADGLAVTDPERRLEVMADSVSGAFGVMSAMIILLLKVAAVSAMSLQQWWFFPLVLGWGRFSQVTAIAFYPYLKPDGKGAFHKKEFHLWQDLLISLFPIVCTALSFALLLEVDRWHQIFVFSLGFCSAVITSKWFQLQFQGHTGDTYGATVEWTEALFLNLGILFLNRL